MRGQDVAGYVPGQRGRADQLARIAPAGVAGFGDHRRDRRRRDRCRTGQDVQQVPGHGHQPGPLRRARRGAQERPGGGGGGIEAQVDDGVARPEEQTGSGKDGIRRVDEIRVRPGVDEHLHRLIAEAGYRPRADRDPLAMAFEDRKRVAVALPGDDDGSALSGASGSGALTFESSDIAQALTPMPPRPAAVVPRIRWGNYPPPVSAASRTRVGSASAGLG